MGLFLNLLQRYDNFLIYARKNKNNFNFNMKKVYFAMWRLQKWYV